MNRCRTACILSLSAIAAYWLLWWPTETAAQTGPPAPNDPPVTADADQQPGSAAATSVSGQATSLVERLDLPALWQNNCWIRRPFNWPLLLIAIFLGWVAGRIAAGLLVRVGRRFAARNWPVRFHVVNDLIGPAKLGLLAAGIAVGVAQLRMSGPLQAFCAGTLRLLYSIAVLWYAFNLVSVVDPVLQRIAKTRTTLSEHLVPWIRKLLRVLLLVVGVMYVAESVFKQDITAWLAAFGVAGIAVTLAAQDSLKTLFGSITILLDPPFQLGERIVFGGYDGTVEDIGFRSTKLRTLTGNLVTIPNSKMVSDSVENIARRPSIRRIMNVTITYDTPREKIEQAIEILRGILQEEGFREPIHPVIDGAEYPPRVYFNDFNPDSLNLFVIYWYAPPAWWDYLEHAQRLNLRILQEFENADIEFAFPTQTLYLAGDRKRQLAVKMLSADLGHPT